MTLHETMHGFMAYYLGDTTAKDLGRLSLNPLKHIDPFMTIILPLVLAISGLPIFGGAKPVPFNPNNLRGGLGGMALVAAAGPLTNLVIAFVAYGATALSQGHVASAVTSAGLILCQVNLGFFIFNILPIPPLDGSRVAYAIVPDFMRRIMESIERFGLMAIFIIVLVASPLISTVIYGGVSLILNLFGRIFGLS